MSRSRKRLHRPQVNVVCTDDGQHQRIRLQRLSDYRRHPEELTEQDVEQHRQFFVALGREDDADGLKPYRKDTILFSGDQTMWTSRTGRYVTPQWRPAGERRPDGGTTYSFRCTACSPSHRERQHRDLQLRYETLAAVLDFLYQLQPHRDDDWIWDLDISAHWIDRVAQSMR